ncbi:MAG: hypothetical protein OES99_08435 [Gammaproteobacteria bacterium]|nr:hypothetical protein [Gammaproteobacteria bacterium]
MNRGVERTRQLLLSGLMLLLLLGCAATNNVVSVPESKPWSNDAQKRRDLMVGKWLGEVPGEHGLRLTLIERNENGTYRLTFRSYKGARYEESVEVGLWGVSGSIYFTIMRGWIKEGEFVPADSTRAYFYDAYNISRLSSITLEFESLDSGHRFTNRRVGNDFQFSD